MGVFGDEDALRKRKPKHGLNAKDLLYIFAAWRVFSFRFQRNYLLHVN